jgi:pimeloyl-ACP methyl ester carboxylesterase
MCILIVTGRYAQPEGYNKREHRGVLAMANSTQYDGTSSTTAIKMLALTLALAVALAAPINAFPASGFTKRDSQCSEIKIPVTISEKRSILDITINDNWDAAALTFNLTARDFGQPDNPLPIASQTASAVESNYTLGATLCGTGATMLVTTHGIIESKLYNFKWSLARVYLISHTDDIIGISSQIFPTPLNTVSWMQLLRPDIACSTTTASELALLQGPPHSPTTPSDAKWGQKPWINKEHRVDAYTDAQFQVEVAVLNSLVDYARETAGAKKVVLVGHSYGAYISTQSAATLGSSVDGLVLTGFSGTLEYFGPFGAGVGFRVASAQDPKRWGDLGTGYLTSSDLYAETFAYFASPHFEHRVAEWSYNLGSEPFAVAELPTLLATKIGFGNVTAPVLVLQGQYDTSACGGNCVGVLDDLRSNFTAAADLQTVDNLPSGLAQNSFPPLPRAVPTSGVRTTVSKTRERRCPF